MKTLILASLAILVAAPLRAEIGGAVKIEHDQAVAARRAARGATELPARPSDRGHLSPRPESR